MRRALAGLVVTSLFGVGAACSATGGAQGGDDRFDAGPAPIPQVSTASGCGAAGGPDGGITWTDLYRDFFGNLSAGGPGCKGTGSCHASADQGGGGTWVCGATQQSCWEGMTGASPPIIDKADPASSVLISVALRSKQGGNMPLSPASCVFTADSLKRIQDWMAAGAQNN